MGGGTEEKDIVIVGCGPAGIQAAIHASRRGARVLVLGKAQNSALSKGHIENYAFIGSRTAGMKMLEVGLEQARGFGAAVVEEDALGISRGENGFMVKLECGREVAAKAVILATGTARKRLGVPNEKELEGSGVSYCVDCDAGFFRNKRVVVTGEGSAAASGALHLLQFTHDVTLVAERLAIAGSLKEELESSKVKLIVGKGLAAIEGSGSVTGVRLSDGERLAADGVFIEKGAKGVLELGAELGLALNDEGHIAVDRNMATSVPGVYAAGDVTGPPWQMAKAVGEGCVAGIRAAEHARGGGSAESGGAG